MRVDVLEVVFFGVCVQVLVEFGFVAMLNCNGRLNLFPRYLVEPLSVSYWQHVVLTVVVPKPYGLASCDLVKLVAPFLRQ